MTNFDHYFETLQARRIEEITEHSHRSILQQLLENLSGSSINVLHEPKREGRFGAPDFKITFAESIIGYVENKKIEENLDKILKSEQIKKYQTLSDNILLTNYIEWIWIREGNVQQRATLCSLTDIADKRKKLDKTKVAAVEKLITSFFSQAPKEIADAKKLAEVLAARARLLKDFLFDELIRQEKDHLEGRLYQLFEIFKTYVFSELTIEEFADAFAQNLVYGLFLAKLNADTQAVNIYNAKKFIPVSFELIRELVNFLDELDNEEYRETKWVVEEVITIMNHLDLKAIHESLSFTKKKKNKDADDIIIKDPYIYFYEDFLAFYDKKLRKSKGVYYTPPPVVNFIVRSIDEMLKNLFKIKDGLADRNKITVLDFATGTGTFLVEVFQQIFDNLPNDSGKKNLLIREHILRNIYGFEYLIAPYTIAHLKLSQFLKDNGYELETKERLQVYLTNTLEPIDLQQKIPLLPALTKESKQAQAIKEKPILVITGNPPYHGHSKNKGEWIANLLRGKDIYAKEKREGLANYYEVDGKPLGERNPKWLQDDYVKFIRFAQDKMEKIDDGIVGIITNHRFLTNPTFKGMRQSLMKTFDQIYLIDLHGSNKPKELTPDGGKDENVFDIEQGVAISFFVKKKGIVKKIVHTDFWGTRSEKYQRSLEEEIKTIAWNELQPTAPFYLFIKQDEKLKDTYYKFQSIKAIFNEDVIGLCTGKDETAYATDEQSLKAQVLAYNPSIKFDTANVKEALYRPFDIRQVYYSKEVVTRPRTKVMPYLFQKNIALAVGRYGRSVKQDVSWNLVFVSNKIADLNLFSRGGANLFPLYAYSAEKKKSNINFDLQKELSANDKSIFNYIYAILHSPTYRSKYAEFLRIDFPRIPFTTDEKLFKKLSKLGKELIDEHLKEENGNKELGVFIGKGSEIVENTTFIQEKKIGKIYINPTQYFDNVPLPVWEFQIGGYQVIDKFLKERKNRKLGKDVFKIEFIINTIDFTIKQMKKIDNLTKNWI